MDDQRAKLAQAIERLPLVGGPTAIGQSVQALQWACYFAKVNEIPRLQPSRKKNGQAKELREFAKLALRLSKFIDTMHADAQATISATGRHVEAVNEDLIVMMRRAVVAAEKVPETAAVPSNRRLAPLQIAQTCASFFVDLTGKPAKLHYNDAIGERTGPYLRFVSDVFEAVGIKANAEHFARLGMEPVDVIGGNGGVSMRKVPAKK
jgi:hypothetical protein